MPKPNPASAEASSEIPVHFTGCESKLLRVEDTFIEKQPRKNKDGPKVCGLTGKVFEEHELWMGTCDNM